jgi:hypothetical protein
VIGFPYALFNAFRSERRGTLPGASSWCSHRAVPPQSSGRSLVREPNSELLLPGRHQPRAPRRVPRIAVRSRTPSRISSLVIRYQLSA